MTYIKKGKKLVHYKIHYFQHEESLVRRPDVESGLFKTLDSLDNETLEGQFSEKEVSKALSDLGGDKAPRPDGFTLAFWKFCWPIVGGEVMQVFEELYSQLS